MAKRRKTTLKDVTRKLVLLRRCLKRRPGDKPFGEWMAEYKAEEKALEEAKYHRCFGD